MPNIFAQIRAFLAFPKKAIISYLSNAQKVRDLTEKVDFLYTLLLYEHITPGAATTLLHSNTLRDKYFPEATRQDVLRTLSRTPSFQHARAQLVMDIADASRASLSNTALCSMYSEAVAGLPDGDSRDVLVYRFLRWLYSHSLDDTLLMSILEKQASLPSAWDKKLFKRRTLLIHISMLALHGKLEDAAALAQRYRAVHGCKDIHMFMPAAWVAHNNGITNTIIKKSAFIYGEIARHRQGATFERYLDGKSVAIVGNGPQELGKSRGKEIDAHDVVIRINSSVVNSTTRQDYGTKTDCWCVNMGERCYSRFPEAKYILLLDNFDRYQIRVEQITNLVTAISSGRIPIAPDRKTIQSLFAPFNFSYFSSGLLAIAYIRHVHNAFSLNNTYGFSFADDAVDNFMDNTLYYFPATNLPPRSYFVHSLQKEKCIIRTLFENRDGPSNPPV